MRRPVKPFVTEYKASNRRSLSAPNEQSFFDNDQASAKSFDALTRSEPEDSHGAAMRAADALFSIPSAAKASSDDPAIVEARLEKPGTPPEKNGGRILRVLDEEPIAVFTALEVEHAPKRRGRKPGSKNKPKVIASGATSAPAEPDSGPLAANEAAVALPHRPVRGPVTPAIRKVAALAAASAPPSPQTASPAPTTRQVKRFTWVRDRLKPGEGWKRRRLPKVCW
jgi:hypothetical protein